jgi:hypothetical protein
MASSPKKKKKRKKKRVFALVAGGKMVKIIDPCFVPGVDGIVICCPS